MINNNQINTQKTLSNHSYNQITEEDNAEYLNLVNSIIDEIKEKQKVPEGRDIEPGDNTVECWKCKAINLIHDDWEYIECADCHALCKIPPKPSRTSKSTSNIKAPCLFTIITCPKCKTSNKCLTKNKGMVCFACRRPFEIVYPDENPLEEECDSLNPHSRYYKFRYPARTPQYPPKNSMPINDLFFPDPVLSGWFPYNPYADFSLPYREAYFVNRERQHQNWKSRVYQDYFGNYKLNRKEKTSFLNQLKEIDRKADNMLQESYQNRYGLISQIQNNQLNDNSYLNKRNNERIEGIKKMYFN